MDITQWYAVFLGALIMLPLTAWIVRCVSGLAEEHLHFFRNYVSVNWKITWLEASLMLTLLAANIVCIGVDVHSAQTLMSRSGLLSSINFAFLCFGHQMSYFYKSGSIEYIHIHYWEVGIMITEVLVHSVSAIILRIWKRDIISQITTWTAISTILIVLMTSLAIPMGRYYEAFTIVHQVSPAIIVATVWIHAGTGELNTTPTIYLLIAACILTFTWNFWLVKIMYQNLHVGSKLPRATVEKDGKIMIVSITFPGLWTFRAGDHVKLCLPGLSWCSFLQWHPFTISSYEHVNGEMTLQLIVRERKGFTALLANKFYPDREMIALIDGPYGKRIQLRTYSTVLLFASGIGIAGLLLYAQQILEEHDAQITCCRKIILFWEIDDDTAYLNIMKQDIRRLSSHGIFELKLIHTRLDIKTEIDSNISMVPGSIAVIICVSPKASKEARKIREDLFEKKVHLFELDFCPKLVSSNLEHKFKY